MHDLVPLRLNINRARDERGNRLPGPLCGLLRRFKRGRGKDSPITLRRSCGLLWAFSHSFANGAIDKAVYAFAGLRCKCLDFLFPAFWHPHKNFVVSLVLISLDTFITIFPAQCFHLLATDYILKCIRYLYAKSPNNYRYLYALYHLNIDIYML
nr:MAG TPA: hypothetical protein [Caudoviricetes sp.]